MLDDRDPETHGDPIDDAWELISQGDLRGALESARSSLEQDEDSPEAHNLMGFILAAEGQLEQALQHYQTAVELDGGYLEAMLNAVDVLSQLGDTQGVLNLTDDALEVAESNDDIADIVLARVDALLGAGRLPEAQAALRDLPAGPFETPQIDFHIGRARFETGDLEGAAASIEQAVHTDRHNPDAFYYLGLLREARGDIRGSTAAFLESRDLDLGAPRPPWAEPIPVFERRVQSAIRRLEPELASQLEGALIVVDEVPGAEVVSEGLDPRLPMFIDDLPIGRDDTLRRVFVYQQRRALGLERGVLEDELVLFFQDELERAFGKPSSVPPGKTKRRAAR